ncbi:hypothetical protein FJT64_014770 [Amphibalanus amphitrite]|uniref:Uncharacterized protein n=1 Tax=Amphibalanus amphitrite TaxID=1232801 RepID=A0A6A4V5A4_AMPAM|nr:hypothetical protein FJT64_014770 [Amphibalanus amphitrite]
MRRICTIEFESLWVGSARLRRAVGPAKYASDGFRCHTLTTMDTTVCLSQSMDSVNTQNGEEEVSTEL